MKWRYFLPIAIHNLRLGGQRTLVALLCIAFGVMSLASMTQLVEVISYPLLVDVRAGLGGDLSISRSQENEIASEEIQELEELQKAGDIDRFTCLSTNYPLTLRVQHTGKMHFIGEGQGIETQKYPLVGKMKVKGTTNASLAALLDDTGDVLITSDLAREADLQPGDEIILSDLVVGVPQAGRVVGIILDTPDHHGNTLYYNQETAQALAGTENAISRVLLTAPDPDALETKLKDKGWNVLTVQQSKESNQKFQDLFSLLLKGAGILGLLVGGIGIANTMQVLLERRTKEIAILKTMGYSQADLLGLFMLEAGLLGLSGSLLGTGLAVAVSYLLVGLLGRVVTFLLFWSFSPAILAGSLLVGILTTLLFAMHAIVRASRARPAALLRNERPEITRMPWAQLLLLGAGLVLPFFLVTSLVMGSAIEGLGVILFALAGLAILGGLLGGAVWLTTRLLPVRRFALVNMARNNLKRGSFDMIFATIALFVGVFTLMMAAVITQSADREMLEHTIASPGFNLTMIGNSTSEDAMQAALVDYPVERLAQGYELPVGKITVTGAGSSADIAPLLIGRTEAADYLLQGAAWNSVDEGVYVYKYASIAEGSQVQVRLSDGSHHTFTVVGTYEHNFALLPNRLSYGLLLPADALLAIGKPETFLLFAQLPGNELQRISTKLGQALPQATLIDQVAFQERYNDVYQNLYVFGMAMAGLSFLAGVLLIANAVSLAMINRSHELGVLKALGYSRRHILTMLAVEYTLIAVITGLAGIAATRIVLNILAWINQISAELLCMDLGTAGVVLIAGIGLTLLTVLAVARKPTEVPPRVILSEGI